MHPNAFLKTFWRLDLRPQVFVAMSFDKKYDARYEQVIKPAIESLTVGEQRLSAYRVDTSKTGDSILTDILNGIAHSQLVLADVSAVGHDSVTGRSYRNGNVMYEVGLALACRHSFEILLVRDDKERFLFDVSTVPHVDLNFNDADAAKILSDRLHERLKEQRFFQDARVERAYRQLSGEEVDLIRAMSKFARNVSWGSKPNTVAGPHDRATVRLIDKQVIAYDGMFENDHAAYQWTDLGWFVVQRVMADTTKKPASVTFNLYEEDEKEATPASDSVS